MLSSIFGNGDRGDLRSNCIYFLHKIILGGIRTCIEFLYLVIPSISLKHISRQRMSVKIISEKFKKQNLNRIIGEAS